MNLQKDFEFEIVKKEITLESDNVEEMVFQGKCYYKTKYNISVSAKWHSIYIERNLVYEKTDNLIGVYVGDIYWSNECESEHEPFQKFDLISYTGHTYTYNLKTERLLYFQYGCYWSYSLTSDELEQLCLFQMYVQKMNNVNDYFGVCHIINLEERIPLIIMANVFHK